MQLLSKNKGFTLIELMIVIAIISILSSMSYQAYQKYIIKVQLVEALNELSISKRTMEIAIAEGQGVYFSLKNKDGFYDGRYRTGLSLTTNTNSKFSWLEEDPKYLNSKFFVRMDVSNSIANNYSPTLKGYFGKDSHKALHDLSFSITRHSDGKWSCYLGYSSGFGDDYKDVQKRYKILLPLMPIGCK